MSSKTKLVREGLLELIGSLQVGDLLPDYTNLADRFDCSSTPIRAVMKELEAIGRVELQQGRRAKVAPWTRSFSVISKALGFKTSTDVIDIGYRRLNPADSGITSHLGLKDDWCLICVRIRRTDGIPVAYQKAYINPNLVSDPKGFFSRHDLMTGGSLSKAYCECNLKADRVVAKLRAGLADEDEARLLEIPTTAPVLRSAQTTTTDQGVLEYMLATYTDAVSFDVVRSEGV